MKKFGGTYLFALLVIALGIYAYIYEYKKPKEQEEVKAEQSRVLKVDSANIVEVEINSGGEPIVMKKSENQWKIESPVKDWGDNSSIDSLLETLTKEKSDVTIPKTEVTDDKIYGFDNPKSTLIVKTNDGVSHKVILGSEDAVGSKKFIRTEAGGDVYVVSSTWDWQLKKKVSDFREKRAFVDGEDKKSKIKTIRYFSGRSFKKPTFELKKDGEKWISNDRSDWKLSSKSVTEFVTKIVNLRAIDFVDNIGEDKTGKAWGFENPFYRIELEFEEGARVFEIAQAKDKSVYTRVNDRDSIMKVANETKDRFDIDLLSFRDKASPFEFDQSLVAEVEVKTDLAKVHTQINESGAWELLNSVESKEIDVSRVKELISKVGDLRVSEYHKSPKNRISRAKGEVKFKKKDGTVLFELKWGPDKDGKSQALTSLINETFDMSTSTLSALPVQTLIRDKVDSKTTDKKEEKKSETTRKSILKQEVNG